MLGGILNATPPKTDVRTSLKAVEYLHKLIGAYNERMQESLEIFQPLPAAQAFYRSKDWHRLLTGSNRSGKTLHGSVEIARTVCGADPFKKSPDKNGRLMLVGRDEEHLADVSWAALYLPGAFPVIVDQATDMIRAIRLHPDTPKQLHPDDLARRSEWQLAPSLIPTRLIDSVTWRRKRRNVPDVCYLRNGWELQMFSAKAKPKQGVKAHAIAFDEEVEGWYSEAILRLTDYGGWFIWLATPQEGTADMYAIHEKAEKSVAGYHETRLLIDDNPYIKDTRKAELRAALSEDELAVRYYGRYAYRGLMVYPEFEPEGLHAVDAFGIPRDWAIYVGFDPGHRMAGALFIAVPPEDRPLHVYHEIIVQNGDAAALATRTAEFLGKRIPEAFVMDKKAGQQTPIGHSRTVMQHHAAEFAAVGLESRQSGSGFFLGTHDIEARTEAVKALLRPARDTGKPRLLVHRAQCPVLERQMSAQVNRKNDPSKRDVRIESCLVDCLEYLADFNPRYYSPLEGSEGMSRQDVRVYDAFQELIEKRRRREEGRNESGYISLGPVGTDR